MEDRAPPAELVAPPAMRHHTETSATAIADLMFASDPIRALLHLL
jgi:hypothetical protein